MNRVPVDAEEFGCLSDVAGGPLKSELDHYCLESFDEIRTIGAIKKCLRDRTKVCFFAERLRLHEGLHFAGSDV